MSYLVRCGGPGSVKSKNSSNRGKGMKNKRKKHKRIAKEREALQRQIAREEAQARDMDFLETYGEYVRDE